MMQADSKKTDGVERKTGMIYRTLGNTGLRVSALGLGTHVTFGQHISDEMAEKILLLAYHSGINFFETCEQYGAGAAETTLGKLLKTLKWRRSSFVICARLSQSGDAVTEQGLSRKHLMEGLRASLDRLQLDYVDILIVTRKSDLPVPIEEVVRTCTHLIHMGWTFYWGTCKWTTAEIMQAQSIARQFNLIPSSLDQLEYNMFNRERMMCVQEMCPKLNLGVIVGAPLCGGILTGKYSNGVPNYSRATLPGQQWLLEQLSGTSGHHYRDQLHHLCRLANRLQATCAQLAIAWCLRTPHVTSVLLGAATVDQLQENLGSIDVLHRLNLPILTEIECILYPENATTFL